jgi:2-polyprenyl-6-methoxyphenol hydroxylase-like FAD-dependent oxidoreductase
MTISVPVCIIGCGPIGLTGALLLSRFGIKTLLLERRDALNSHPRSRFVDTNTMELLRELGIDKAVEKTGLGPEWTACNRWCDALTRNEYACIPSPTFHAIARDSSPCVPVMTAQDLVEQALIKLIDGDPNIDLRFQTTASELRQDQSGTYLTLRNTDTGVQTAVTAQFTIGADGPGSMTRAVIGAELNADPRPINSQDVIFDADLSSYVNERKGALLYNTPAPLKGVIFQPLDGKRRWRCQVVVPTPELIPEEAIRNRICEALGTQDHVPMTIQSMRLWQPTPGCTTHFSQGRIFLAGDAAHISIPTGGMGNNTGFSGIRNLAWKLAFVIRGVSNPDLLETYNEEHRPLALERIDLGTRIFDAMGPMMMRQMLGEDISEQVEATGIYGNYDGALMGFELRSRLIAANEGDPPPVVDPVKDFVPAVRSGRRAPHLWLDQAHRLSVLDYFGRDYVLLLGPGTSCDEHISAVNTLIERGFPVKAQQLPALGNNALYPNDTAVLVRPDGIVADHWCGSELAESNVTARLAGVLPL